MLTALENRVVNLEESLENMKETLELVEGRTDGFHSMEEQVRDFVLDSLDANAEKMNELVESTTKKLAERDENLQDMVLAMKKEMEDLKGELTIYKAALSNGMLSLRSKQQAIDIPKSEKFKGARSARDSWAKYELRRQGITELTVSMVEAESFVELGPTEDKFESSNPNGNGNGERNHEEDEEGHNDDGNSTDSTSGNGKPRDAKRGSNNPRDKGKRIKCFLCQGPHMVR
ncbi:hypothetical protein Goklo_021446, partial [Gossypium klotzschianum]|nr:hypothetical protein [Gossypium klotzschianum]